MTEIKHVGSEITVDGEHLLTLDAPVSMLALLGNRTNHIHKGMVYGADYLVRSGAGNVVGKWYVEKYGWSRFWPPSATLTRVERMMRALRVRAMRRVRVVCEVALRIKVDPSLPRETAKYDGKATEEIVVHGINRYGNVLKYMVRDVLDTHCVYVVGSLDRGAKRTPIGDDFSRVTDRSYQAWCQYHRFNDIFRDLVLARFLGDGRKVSIHRLTVDGHGYWFRLFESTDEYDCRLRVETLDGYGSGEFTETVV